MISENDIITSSLKNMKTILTCPVVLVLGSSLSASTPPSPPHSETIKKELRVRKMPFIQVTDMEFRRALNTMEALIYREGIRATKTDLEYQVNMYPRGDKPISVIFDKEKKPTELTFRIEDATIYDALEEIARITDTVITIDFESVRFSSKPKSEH